MMHSIPNSLIAALAWLGCMSMIVIAANSALNPLQGPCCAYMAMRALPLQGDGKAESSRLLSSIPLGQLHQHRYSPTPNLFSASFCQPPDFGIPNCFEEIGRASCRERVCQYV